MSDVLIPMKKCCFRSKVAPESEAAMVALEVQAHLGARMWALKGLTLNEGLRGLSRTEAIAFILAELGLVTTFKDCALDWTEEDGLGIIPLS